MIALVVLAVVMALLTWSVGWWTVIVVGLVVGAVWRGRSAARVIALAAALGWAGLLVLDARAHRLGALATLLGGVFPVPGVVLLLLTLLFAAAGAWSAAALAGELVKLASARRDPDARREADGAGVRRAGLYDEG